MVKYLQTIKQNYCPSTLDWPWNISRKFATFKISIWLSKNQGLLMQKVRPKVQILWNNEKSDLMLEQVEDTSKLQNVFSSLKNVHCDKKLIFSWCEKKIEARRHWCKTKTAILFKNFYEKEFAIFHQIKIDTKHPLFISKLFLIRSAQYLINQTSALVFFGRKWS